MRKNFEPKPARLRRATSEEQAAYRKTSACYPLYGFITIAGIACAVEFPNEGREQPKYEVMAPEGFHFANDDLHTLLCMSLADMGGRIQGASFEACSDRCRRS